MKVAITGGIGSGKSYVCEQLKKDGIEVYDCDNAAKRIMRESVTLKRQLVELIGKDSYNGDIPNKARIASFILSSDENTRLVNSVVHPAVAKDFIESGYSFMECAILFTSGFNRLVDKIICVAAPLEVRLSRIMNRDGIPMDKAKEWVDCQMSQEEVIKRSDYVIMNNGTDNVNSQIEEILKRIKTETVINKNN